jgi:hypothetical protein
MNYYDTRILSGYYSYNQASVLLAEIKDNFLHISMKKSFQNFSIIDFVNEVKPFGCERYCNTHSNLEKLLQGFEFVNIEQENGNEQTMRELDDLFQSLKPFVIKQYEDIEFNSESDKKALKILISKCGNRMLAASR